MPDPSYKSETAAMNNKAKELRAKVNAAAKQKNVSVPKSALDNFIDTYKKTKVGSIQRAISKFLSGFNTKADYTSGKSTTAKLTTRAKVNRATSQGGRSRANVIEDKQKKLAAKSAAQGGGSVLSQRKADKIASDDTKIVLKKSKPKVTSSTTISDAQKKSQTSKPKAKAITLPTPPPKRPKKNKQVTPPKSKPKLYATINPLTGKPVDKKVTAAQHLANIDKFKARKKAQTTIDAALKKATKKTKRK